MPVQTTLIISKCSRIIKISNKMERKKQTGHICRWMVLGIMTAIVIVGCTIVIGHVSINLQQAHWGAKALDTISERLQRELPGLRGFSSGNLKKMRIFYEEWQCLSIGSPLANQLQ